MLGRFRSAIYNAINNLEEEGGGAASPTHSATGGGGGGGAGPRAKYKYQRPAFLKLDTDDEIQVTADHAVRPIIVPRDVNALPWHAGYAETINAGKSRQNEDQACVREGRLNVVQGGRLHHIPYTLFSIYDGHAGSACAVAASNDLWQVIQARLEQVGPQLLSNGDAAAVDPLWPGSRPVSTESLIIGALETAFWETDQVIGEEKKMYHMPGGCTVLVALFILGKLYVSNAGDSRSVLCRMSRAYPMSYDFTPVSERQRLQNIGRLQPHLLGDEYTCLEYARKPSRRDIGSRMLYRDAFMTGWAYKVVQETDLKFPMVYGEGKRSRLLATIGVTRGFGDHDLRAQSQLGTILIKPFLSPQPEVRVLDIENEKVTGEDILILATDGLWDVVTNEEVASIVQRGLTAWDNESRAGKYRYLSLAQDLVMSARGKLKDRNWKRANGSPATIDDISVFVIPILPYKEEYAKTINQNGVAESHEDSLENGLDAMEVEGSGGDPQTKPNCDSSQIDHSASDIPTGAPHAANPQESSSNNGESKPTEAMETEQRTTEGQEDKEIKEAASTEEDGSQQEDKLPETETSHTGLQEGQEGQQAGQQGGESR